MSFITANKFKYTILSFIWLEYGWEWYLSIRQYTKILETRRTPFEIAYVMSDSTFQRARKYALAKIQCRFLKTLVATVMSTIIIYTDLMAQAWTLSEWLYPNKEEFVTSCLWLLILSIISFVVDLPFSAYEVFTIEQNFGFNRQTPLYFIRDHIIQFILVQIMSSCVAMLIIASVRRGGDYFFLYLWLYTLLTTIVLITIYPSFIAPLFDNFKPLPEGELRTKINNLATDLNFPLTEIYIVDGSSRSSHSNAYFYGFLNSKRIVLSDTLFQQVDGGGLDSDQIVAILAHELGHWYHNHVTRNFIIVQLNLFFWFSAFAYFFKNPILYEALGFKGVKPILVGFLSVIQFVLMPYNVFLAYIMISISRQSEFEADAFAAKLGRGRALKSALISLYSDNLAFPVSDSLYAKWHHSHPSLLERLLALNNLI